MHQIKNEDNNKMQEAIITIIYDNNALPEGLESDWGFACLIEFEKTKLLFDTGDNGNILLSNMAKLNIDPKTIDIVFLSHFHHDHTGGLKYFLNNNSNVIVYYPQLFPVQIVKVIENSGADHVPVSSSRELQTNIFSLGESGEAIPEQSLVIKTIKGLVVITGCAHPGIINILEKAKGIFPGNSVYLVLGGFHLHRLSEEEINKVIQTIFDMHIMNIAPTHCTGDAARKISENVFGTGYIEAGTGDVIHINQ